MQLLRSHLVRGDDQPPSHASAKEEGRERGIARDERGITRDQKEHSVSFRIHSVSFRVPFSLLHVRMGWSRRALVVLLLLSVLAGAGAEIWRAVTPAQASCQTYTIRWGDTLWQIAMRFHTTTWNLVQLNHIANPNLIIAGQSICVAASAATTSHTTNGGGGDPLEWSNPGEVRWMLMNAADRHRLPRNLVLAIAWRESSWTQHVISWDGGVGTMQLMWYTTAWLNGYLGTRYNPDRLYDNIELGVSYLAILWNDFHGNLDDLISAYNEGERAVRTYGIFNWWYVNSVLWLMRYFA